MPINCSGDGVAAAYRAGWGVIPAEFYSAPGLEMGAGLGVRFVNGEGTEIAGGDRIRRFRLVRVVQRRTESRGNVLREDFPYMDNQDWLTCTFARMGGNGEVDLFEEPIPADEHHRMPDRENVLHPFFRS